MGGHTAAAKYVVECVRTADEVRVRVGVRVRVTVGIGYLGLVKQQVVVRALGLFPVPAIKSANFFGDFVPPRHPSMHPSMHPHTTVPYHRDRERQHY